MALHRPDAEEWRKARRAELTALIELGVFREARRKRAGSQWLPAQWVYDRKPDGRYKARFVACGNRLLQDQVF